MNLFENLQLMKETNSEYDDNGIDLRTGRKWGVPADFEGEDNEWDLDNNRPYDSFYDKDDIVECDNIVEDLDNDSIDSKVRTMIDNIKNWTERDVHISSIACEDYTATFEVYIPETNEYIGSWEVDLDRCEDQDYCGDIAAEIDAIDIEDVIEEDWQDDWVEPYVEKEPIEEINGLYIYKGTDQYGNEAYYIFLEDEDPEPGYEEWQTETLELAREWASSYEYPDDSYEDDFYDDDIINEGIYR